MTYRIYGKIEFNAFFDQNMSILVKVPLTKSLRYA